jgi:hypothetical protein
VQQPRRRAGGILAGVIPRRALRPSVVAVLAAAVLALAACGGGKSGAKPHGVGGEEQSRQTEAQTEAIYVALGPLKYQVQLSRVLNPADIEDHAYLVGLPPGTTPLRAEEVWFAIFMRVEDDSDAPGTSTDRYEIVDTSGRIYRPLALDTALNPFAYVPRRLEPGDIQPPSSSPAGQGPIQGELLLFRMTAHTFQNRPLRLRFRDMPTGQLGIIDLDV